MTEQKKGSALPPALPVKDNDEYFGLQDGVTKRQNAAALKAYALKDLSDKTDPLKGAAQVGWDGDTVGSQMNLSKKLASYAALRAYTGPATRVEITQSQISGTFTRRPFAVGDNEIYGIKFLSPDGLSVWERDFVGLSDSRWFDETTDATDPLSIQRAVNYSQPHGAPSIRVDTEINVPTALTNRSRVLLIGDGKLTGEGAYRKQVTAWNAQTGKTDLADVDPVKHLKRFSAAKAPNVVLVGSSTGAWQPNSVDTASTVARFLSERISRYNTSKKISFFNRCIGGQSYPHLDSVPTSFPNWYSDHGKPWLDYIKDLSPDVVFIIMGSGDSSAMSYENLKSVTDKLNAFAKVPDIIYITQPSVNPDPHPNFATFGTRDGQEGRDYAAGVIRSFALFNGYGFIDANRVGGIVLDGRDLMDTVSERVYTSVPLSGGYTSTLKAHDYSMRLRFTGDLAAIDAAFSVAGNTTNPTFFRTGPGNKGDPRGGDIMYIKKNAAGNFRFEFFLKGDMPAANYANIDTTIPFPTSSFTLDFFKCGCTVGISLADYEDTAFMMFPIISGGGEFTPQVGGRTSGGPFVWMDYLNLGRPHQYIPALTSQQAWGEKSSDASTQLPWGGNGANHFSSLGTDYIYGPLLNKAVLTASKVADGTYTPAVGAITNTAAPITTVAMWSRVGDTVSVSGSVSITPSASGTVQVDISLPLPSNLLIPADLAGTCGAGGVAGVSGSVWGNDAADMARIQLTTSVLTAQNVRFTFSYRIK